MGDALCCAETPQCRLNAQSNGTLTIWLPPASSTPIYISATFPPPRGSDPCLDGAVIAPPPFVEPALHVRVKRQQQPEACVDRHYGSVLDSRYLPQRATTCLGIGRLTLASPRLRPAPQIIYSQDGKEIKPPPEKSFLAKYWFYLAIPLVLLSLGGGDAPAR